MNKKILKNLTTIILIIFLSNFIKGEAYSKPPLNKVYTPKRVKAYKKLIIYYNPSITSNNAERIARSIIYYSYLNNIEDDRFVAAVITIESMFNPYAVSRSGAMGLGQLMPNTAKSVKVKNPFNIEQNIAGSCKYLKKQLLKYSHLPRQHKYELTLASYNAGPGAVRRWGGIPPYTETRNYVFNVINVWREISGLKKMTSSQIRNLKARSRRYKARSKRKKKRPSKVVITRKYIKTIVSDETSY